MRLLQRHSKGQVLVLLALTMLMLLAVIALAIDIGRAYGVKAKLNAAVDAASFEAANSLAEGSGEAGMKQRAQDVAREFFAANYRLRFLGTDPPVPSVSAERELSTGKWTVRVAATTAMPTYFAGLFGFGTLNVSAVSETERGTLDLVLVVDTSNSMNIGNQMEEVRKRARDFVAKFDPLDDRIALVAFASGAYTAVSLCGQSDPEQKPPKEMRCGRGFSRDTLNAAITNLAAGGMTASEEGLKKALEQLQGLDKNLASGHRAIVFFSDGAPNTFNGQFPVASGGQVQGNLYSGVAADDLPQYIYEASKTNGAPQQVPDVIGLPDTDTSGKVPAESKEKKRTLTKIVTAPYLKCDANAVARNMTENVALMARNEGIAVYSIGLGQELTISQMFDPSCSTSKESGTLVLRRLANTPDSDSYDPDQPTGIFCLSPDTGGLKQCFDRVAGAILRITR